jgi:hypothetical protein
LLAYWLLGTRNLRTPVHHDRRFISENQRRALASSTPSSKIFTIYPVHETNKAMTGYLKTTGFPGFSLLRLWSQFKDAPSMREMVRIAGVSVTLTLEDAGGRWTGRAEIGLPGSAHPMVSGFLAQAGARAELVTLAKLAIRGHKSRPGRNGKS